jgi:hypothetical protein
VIADIWHTCDVGNGSANGAALLFCFLVMWGAFPSLWALTIKVFGSEGIGGAYAVAVCASAVIAWGVIAWIGVLDSYPAPVCPGNVPPWWPEIIPV